MKKWNEAEIVELNIAETANGTKPGWVEGQRYNDDKMETVTEFVQELLSGIF